MPQDVQTDVMSIRRETKHLAQHYRALIGKAHGITGEITEYEAARILGLDLTVAWQAGYDAVEERAPGSIASRSGTLPVPRLQV